MSTALIGTPGENHRIHIMIRANENNSGMRTRSCFFFIDGDVTLDVVAQAAGRIRDRLAAKIEGAISSISICPGNTLGHGDFYTELDSNDTWPEANSETSVRALFQGTVRRDTLGIDIPWIKPATTKADIEAIFTALDPLGDFAADGGIQDGVVTGSDAAATPVQHVVKTTATGR